MKRRRLISLLTAVGILAAGVAALLLLTSFRAEAAVVETPLEVRTVRTSMLVPGTQSTTVEADGFLESARSVDIVSPVSGKVTGSREGLKGGVRVEEGEELLVLDDRRARLAFENARSQMINTTSRFITSAGLSRDGLQMWNGYLDNLVTAGPRLLPELPELNGREALLAATMGVTAARNGLEAAALDLQDHRIIAPFGGSLSGDGVAVGALVSPGAPLATLYETGRLELSLSLPISRGDGLEPGSPLTVISENGTTMEAGILRMGPSLGSGNQMLRVHAGLEPRGSGDWMPGSYVRALISGREYEAACRVSRKLLIDDRLPVLADGKLALMPVEILAYDGQDVIFSTGSTEPLEVVETVLQNPVAGMFLQREAGL